jgi:hypothetical protein
MNCTAPYSVKIRRGDFRKSEATPNMPSEVAGRQGISLSFDPEETGAGSLMLPAHDVNRSRQARFVTNENSGNAPSYSHEPTSASSRSPPRLPSAP